MYEPTSTSDIDISLAEHKFHQDSNRWPAARETIILGTNDEHFDERATQRPITNIPTDPQIHPQIPTSAPTMSLLPKGKHDQLAPSQSVQGADAGTAATLQKMVPDDQTFTADTIDQLNKCGAEFVAKHTREAQAVAEREGKKTATAEHYLQALKNLGSDEYHDEVAEVAKDHVCHPIPTRQSTLGKTAADKIRGPTR
jgi:histone H3/H4